MMLPSPWSFALVTISAADDPDAIFRPGHQTTRTAVPGARATARMTARKTTVHARTHARAGRNSQQAPENTGHRARRSAPFDLPHAPRPRRFPRSGNRPPDISSRRSLAQALNSPGKLIFRRGHPGKTGRTAYQRHHSTHHRALTRGVTTHGVPRHPHGTGRRPRRKACKIFPRFRMSFRNHLQIHAPEPVPQGNRRYLRRHPRGRSRTPVDLAFLGQFLAKFRSDIASAFRASYVAPTRTGRRPLRRAPGSGRSRRGKRRECQCRYINSSAR